MVGLSGGCRVSSVISRQAMSQPDTELNYNNNISPLYWSHLFHPLEKPGRLSFYIIYYTCSYCQMNGLMEVSGLKKLVGVVCGVCDLVNIV